MDVKEYREELRNQIQISAEANSINPEDQFLSVVTEIMSDAEEFDDFVNCHFEGQTELKNSMMIDGYSYNENEGECSVFISKFFGEFEKNNDIIDIKTVTEMFKQMIAFLGEAIRFNLYEQLEESSEVYDFARFLYENNEEIFKFNLFLITDAFLEHEDIKMRQQTIHGKRATCEVWDIQRIFTVLESNNRKNKIEINFKEYGTDGIPCVKAVDYQNVIADIEVEKTLTQKDSDENIISYSSYLAVIPGNILHELYYSYGSKLLEGNVRSFLSDKGKVNKSIQRTIIYYPEMFFAYNNGIAATASNIETEMTTNGLVITKIENLQIVNGGQTTASITNTFLQAKNDEKVELSKLFVPMKISVLEHSMSEKIIPKISEYSNSQNKVDASDFFSNHPFHKRMEDFSRKIPAPVIDGNQYHQYWYYERLRGQYLQGMMKFKAKSKDLNEYEKKYPKNQVIKMVDLAKYIELYEGKPNIVSKGKQALFRDFSSGIKNKWIKSEYIFNETYFKKVVCLAIIYTELDTIIKNSEWYQKQHSYKANVIAYTMGLLFELVRKLNNDKAINFQEIWNNQTMYKELKDELVVLSEEVYSFITDEDRPKANVTEWCKDEKCWNKALQEKWTFSDEFCDSLVIESESFIDIDEAKKLQKVAIEVNDMEFVLSSGKEYWEKLLKWATERKLLTEMEEGIILFVIKGFRTGQLISDKQLKVLMKTRKRLLDNGMPLEF